jgi:hypothetical protein
MEAGLKLFEDTSSIEELVIEHMPSLTRLMMKEQTNEVGLHDACICNNPPDFCTSENMSEFGILTLNVHYNV